MKISDPVFDRMVSLREAYRIMEKFVHAHFERGETTTFELFSYLSVAPDETSSDPAAFADFPSVAETVMQCGSAVDGRHVITCRLTRSMELVRPAQSHLASYADALRRGWSADTQRPAAGAEELERIIAAPETFLAEQSDPTGCGPPIQLPDGSVVPRLPSYRLWMWDGDFCGSISLRWQPGTTALPPHCLGHIGYAVVPWKRRRGYATRALAAILPLAREQGLPFVELTTDVENTASQRVILHNGGQLVEHFLKPAAHGSAPALRFRIQLS